jgi:hypothetical protein
MLGKAKHLLIKDEQMLGTLAEPSKKADAWLRQAIARTDL